MYVLAYRKILAQRAPIHHTTIQILYSVHFPWLLIKYNTYIFALTLEDLINFMSLLLHADDKFNFYLLNSRIEFVSEDAIYRSKLFLQKFLSYSILS